VRKILYIPEFPYFSGAIRRPNVGLTQVGNHPCLNVMQQNLRNVSFAGLGAQIVDVSFNRARRESQNECGFADASVPMTVRPQIERIVL